MHNPWIPIADLLSGFVVVTLLLFVGTAIQPRLERAAQEQREARAATAPPSETPAARAARMRAEAFSGLKRALAPEESRGLLAVDLDRQLVRLNDVSFAHGSACLGAEARAALAKISPLVGSQMSNDGALEVHLEGHTDPAPIAGIASGCGVFADNTQLSALRAANARAELIRALPPSFRSRMPVTGYGPDRLLNMRDPMASENRRVELRWVWRSSEEGNSAPRASAP